MIVFNMAIENIETQRSYDFDLVFARYFNRLVYFVKKSIRGEIEDAQNIAQEAFIVFLEKSGELDFENEREAVSYIFQTARNLIMNHNKKSGVRRLIDTAFHFFEAGGFKREKYAEIEIQTDFDAALGKIPETYREVIMMKYVLEMSIGQIAGVLGISDGTVKSRLFNGSIKMAKLLKDYSGADEKMPGSGKEAHNE